MEISVIIPTFNGANKIEATLTALSCQTIRDFEVVVIVDGSTDNTIDVVKRFEKKFPKLIIHSTPNQGRANAKNEGVSVANGNILVFIDDDIRLFDDALARYQQFHFKNKDTIVFGHLEMDPLMAKQNDFWNYRRTVESSWRENQDLNISLKNYAITSANLSVTKRIFNLVGIFDPTLKDSEDFVFGVKALQAGIPVIYSPQIRGYHDDFSTLMAYVRRQNEYIKSKYVVLEKYPEYLQLLPEQFKWVRPLPGDGLKKMIFSSEGLWKGLISIGVFLVLPRLVRYKFYSAYIYVHSVLLNRTVRF
ncbi:glycosyltransferase family 2 protein [soil metagenome]